ncbi:MAG: penicillin-binding protein activator, partial [Pseudomonadaceae bacterium]|nr:penicillin-binding protein activator [Pseudomonadaceae bacterium]
MIAGLRTLCFFGLTALLAACTSTPSSNLGELPRTPQGSIEELLQQASVSPQEQASGLLLAAADLAHQQNDDGQAARILQQVPLDGLKPAQQVFASTLKAELAMARNKPKSALKALSHPSFTRLSELPVEQQLRSQLVRAKALEANGQTLEAARERVFIAPLLSDSAASNNHEAIWALVASLPS